MLVRGEGLDPTKGKLSAAAVRTMSEPEPGRHPADPFRLEWRDELFDVQLSPGRITDPSAAWPILRDGRPVWRDTMRGVRAAMLRELDAQGRRLDTHRQVAA